MDQRTLLELTRITARVSATLFVAALFAVGATRLVTQRVAMRVFGTFVFAHLVHFSIVFLLAYATGGANFRARGGYPLTIAVGVLFAASAVAGILRLRVEVPTRALRIAGDLGVGFIWFAFTATYASRVLVSPIYGISTVALIAAALAWLYGSRRRATTSPVDGMLGESRVGDGTS